MYYKAPCGAVPTNDITQETLADAIVQQTRNSRDAYDSRTLFGPAETVGAGGEFEMKFDDAHVHPGVAEHGDATGDAVGSYTGLVHNILQNRFKFLKRDALPDTHVGITINYIDISRQGAGDEACGLPEVR